MSAPSTVEQPEHNSPVPLQYVNAAPVSRRHFRLLLFLTLLNTFLIVGGFVAAPFIQESTKQFWHDFQQRRIQQRAEKAFQATYQQAKNFTLPAGTVVYDEDPQRAAALSAAGGYRNSDVNSYTYITPRPLQLPVLRNPPALPANLPNYRAVPGQVFLHGRLTPAGGERLVSVYLEVSQDMNPTAGATVRRFDVRTQRSLIADVYKVNQTVLDHVWRGRTRFYNNARHVTHIAWTKGETWEQGKVDVTAAGLLRIFAGQPDPNDPAHFTITYEYDGKAGTIDGRLRDDDMVALDLKPAHLIRKDPSENEWSWDPDPQGGE